MSFTLERIESIERPEYRSILERFKVASGRRADTYRDYNVAFAMERRRQAQQEAAYDDAIRCLTNRIKRNPTHAAHFHNLAEILKAKGDTARALKALKKAVQLNPGNVFARNDYALHLHDSGRHQEAMDQISIAVRASPQNPLLHKNAAAIFGRKGQYREAQHHAEEAIRFAPNDPAGYRLLARIRDMQGNTEHGLKLGRVAIFLGPGRHFQYDEKDAEVYKRVAIQSVGMGQTVSGYAHEHMDASRALLGKRVMLPYTQTTIELLHKTKAAR